VPGQGCTAEAGVGADGDAGFAGVCQGRRRRWWAVLGTDFVSGEAGVLPWGHVAHGVRGPVHRFDLASRPFGESGSGPVGAAASSSPGPLGRQGYGQNGWRLSWVSGRGGRRRVRLFPRGCGRRALADGIVPAPSSSIQAPVQAASRCRSERLRRPDRARAAGGRTARGGSCGWNGPEHRLDWDAIGEQKLIEAAHGTADTCVEDWTRTPPRSSSRPSLAGDGHCPAGPAAGGDREAGEGLTAGGRTGSPPAGGNRRTGRILAGHAARQDTTAEQAAAALGLNEDAARKLMPASAAGAPVSDHRQHPLRGAADAGGGGGDRPMPPPARSHRPPHPRPPWPDEERTGPGHLAGPLPFRFRAGADAR
jgi:hypothetical protein